MTYNELAALGRIALRFSGTNYRLMTRQILFEASFEYWNERGCRSTLWDRRTAEDIAYADNLVLHGHTPHDHHLSGRAKAYDD